VENCSGITIQVMNVVEGITIIIGVFVVKLLVPSRFVAIVSKVLVYIDQNCLMINIFDSLALCLYYGYLSLYENTHTS